MFNAALSGCIKLQKTTEILKRWNVVCRRSQQVGMTPYRV